MAQPSLQAAHLLLPQDLRLLKPPIIDWRVAAFAMLAAIGPIVLCALVPAGTASGAAIAGGLTGGMTATPGRSRYCCGTAAVCRAGPVARPERLMGRG